MISMYAFYHGPLSCHRDIPISVEKNMVILMHMSVSVAVSDNIRLVALWISAVVCSVHVFDI